MAALPCGSDMQNLNLYTQVGRLASSYTVRIRMLMTLENVRL